MLKAIDSSLRDRILYVYSLYVTVTYRLHGWEYLQETWYAAMKRRARSMQGNGRPVEVYRTKFGKAVLTKAEDYLPSMPEKSGRLGGHVTSLRPLATEGIREPGPGRLRRLARLFWSAGAASAQGHGQPCTGFGWSLSAGCSLPVVVQLPGPAAAVRRTRLLSGRRVLLAQPGQAAFAHRMGEQAQDSRQGFGQYGLVARQVRESQRPTSATCWHRTARG